jgi:hypothetical protein
LSRSHERGTGSIWLARQVGIWATRTFVFMAGIAATMITGYVIFPALHWLVLPISLVLFAAGALCCVMWVVRTVQFLLAGRRENRSS